MSVQALIKSENLNSVEGLELLARLIVEGYMAGLNQSLKTGTGQEFSQYRSYQPGDDLRLLDWKMYGRSDRYYIRQAEVETNINVRFFIDATASMNHEDEGINKLQYARLMAATLGYLAVKQGDAISLTGFSDKGIFSLEGRQGRHHYQRFLYELISISGAGKWPVNSGRERSLLKGQKEMIFVFTDIFEADSEITDTLKLLKTRNNEVILFHILGRNEIEYDFKGFQIFQDLETGEKIQSGMDARQYKLKLAEYLSSVRNMMMDFQINYEQFTMHQDITKVLPLFLKKRNKLI